MRTTKRMWIVGVFTMLGVAGCAETAQKPVIIERTTYVIERQQPVIATDAGNGAAAQSPVQVPGPAPVAADASQMPTRQELGAVHDYGPAEANRDMYLNQPSVNNSANIAPTYLPFPVTNRYSTDRSSPPTNGGGTVVSPERVRTVEPAK